MELAHSARIDSDAVNEFARVMKVGANRGFAGGKERSRLNLDQRNVKNGLGQLVLTLVKLLHELLERQAIRRMEAGSLTDSEIERIGVTLMLQTREIERLREEFGLKEEDLNLDLGPLGKLL
jgi:Gas vesicle protein K